jgi:predicted metal-dependent phosphoesterase TrpH
MSVYRILLHNHSTWSDGRMPLSAIARLGEYLRVSAVVMSEHDNYFTPDKWGDYVNACREASTAKCIVVPGIEYSFLDDDVHILTVGTPYFHGVGRDIVETLSAIRGEGGAAVLAHPGRRGSFDKISTGILSVLDGIEIWNRKVDGLLPAKQYFKFAQKHLLAVTVGMDLHVWRQVFPMWNEMEVGTKLLDGKAVATALRQRRVIPSCIVGELTTGLEGRFSIGLATLASGEWGRRNLRDAREISRSIFRRLPTSRRSKVF